MELCAFDHRRQNQPWFELFEPTSRELATGFLPAASLHGLMKPTTNAFAPLKEHDESSDIKTEPQKDMTTPPEPRNASAPVGGTHTRNNNIQKQRD
jgi:hypothetical protein